MTTDAELLQRYAASQAESAFAELVRRHLDGVYSAALRRVGGDTHLAKDVAQAVFISLARQSRTLASHPFITAWLYAATRNEAANTVRRERRRKAREAAAHAMNENNSASAESGADWSRLAPVLDEAIDELSEKDRAAILLRFIEKKPFAAIGEKLRVTEDAARMRVDRALDKLRVLLARRGLTSTSAALGVVLTSQAVIAAPTTIATSVTLAAIGTIPLTAVVGTSTAGALALGSALSAKIYLSIAVITVASLGYVAFTHSSATNTATTAAPVTTAAITSTPTTTAAKSKITPRIRQVDEVAARAFFKRHPDVGGALVALYDATPLTTLTNTNVPLSQRDLDDPQALAVWRENERAALSSQYAPFYEHVHLPAEQRAGFETIIIERTVSSAQTIPYAEVSLRTVLAAHRLLLGDALFKELRIFERNRHFYETSINFSAHAVLAGHSLTSDESDKLAQLLTAYILVNQDWHIPRTAYWKNAEKRSVDSSSSDQRELLNTKEPVYLHHFRQQLERAIEAALESDRKEGIPSAI